MTLFQDEAMRLIETEAPLKPNSLEYKVTKLISEGEDLDEIAERLGESLDTIKDAVETVVKEFIKNRF